MSLRPSLVARGKWQQSDVTRLLDGAREAALVCGANTGQTPRHNLAALGHELLQEPHVTIGNGINLLGAELADLFAAKELAATARAAGTTGSAARAAAWSSFRP
jgi:hypothetical protein